VDDIQEIHLINTRPEEDIMKLLMELATNSMLVQMFPHLSDLAKVCLLILVGTASVEQSFSQMKMVLYKCTYILL